MTPGLLVEIMNSLKEEKRKVFNLVFVYLIANAFNGRCTSGWTFYGGSCYNLPLSRKSFSDAQTSCESMDAALASISSEEENQAIKSKWISN